MNSKKITHGGRLISKDSKIQFSPESTLVITLLYSIIYFIWSCYNGARLYAYILAKYINIIVNYCGQENVKINRKLHVTPYKVHPILEYLTLYIYDMCYKTTLDAYGILQQNAKRMSDEL